MTICIIFNYNITLYMFIYIYIYIHSLLYEHVIYIYIYMYISSCQRPEYGYSALRIHGTRQQDLRFLRDSMLLLCGTIRSLHLEVL